LLHTQAFAVKVKENNNGTFMYGTVMNSMNSIHKRSKIADSMVSGKLHQSTQQPIAAEAAGPPEQ